MDLGPASLSCLGLVSIMWLTKLLWLVWPCSVTPAFAGDFRGLATGFTSFCEGEGLNQILLPLGAPDPEAISDFINPHQDEGDWKDVGQHLLAQGILSAVQP